MIDTFCDGPAVLHRHITDNHHGKTVHHCDDCNSVFSSEANYKRHVAIVHNKQCIYCNDEADGGGRRRGGDRYNRLPNLATVRQLRQHVATTHNQNVCNFCGDMFTSGEGLYRHQTDHCQLGYTCTSCNSVFDSLTQCQAHMVSHVSRIGACSPYEVPSQRQHTLLWHTFIYRHKPWERDVQAISGQGQVQDRINEHYYELHRTALPHGGHPPPQRPITQEQHEDMKARAYQNISTQYGDRLKQVYADNLRQYVNHTTSKDGRIERFNVNMLDKRPFLSQVESALRAIFDA